ncbi:hypothetical protein HYFRA_00012993 [Hymenoscyphus fraxineus]|uniref:Glutathione S-transferase n=1 Tax=Hymenoscyphus fraxineus TaxID=746836 RepID=A0A9N9L7I7_9HELO|nr:hypothetical protein HYFRA_00012993 [Hymenoscyphus fraxineus]
MAASFYHQDTPSDIKNAKGLHLITLNTPNGKKVQILCEELRAKYGFEFTSTILDTKTMAQKSDWFLTMNPNGRIPIIVDNTKKEPFVVMESSAELVYIQKEYDPENAFGFEDLLEQSQCLQWLFFWHGGGGPIQGQLSFFGTQDPQDKFATERFLTETKRIYGVLELHLSGKYTNESREYIAGKGKGRYSIADMGLWPWINGWGYTGLITPKDMEEFPHLMKWLARIGERTAVKEGTNQKYA